MIKRIKQLAATLAASSFVFAGALAPVASAAETLVVPSDLAVSATTWYFYNDNTNTPSTAEVPGTYEFVGDNGSVGDGSVKFTLGADTERYTLATAQFAGTRLADVTNLAFDMYTPASSSDGANTTLFLNFDVDFDTTPGVNGGYKGRLVYVPEDNGVPATDTWQTWDAGASDSNWRWSRYESNGNTWPDGNPNATLTKAEILAEWPEVGIFNESFTGQFLVRAGHPGPNGLEGFVDNIVFNDTNFNFEEVYPVSGEITSPDEGEVVNGTLVLGATYDDGDLSDTDSVLWAVRQGDCDTGTTVLGNVDGHFDVSSWDNETFAATFNVSAFDSGSYCFVFDPNGEDDDVRLTREFMIQKSYATNKDECKKGGWQAFGIYKNQGDCVSHVATKGKNKPANFSILTTF